MNQTKVTSPMKDWQQFRQITSDGRSLLRELPRFSDAILVAGCQRSGTTMLARAITESDGMVNYWFGRDDELDAALILSGLVDHEARGRYCFQTTYVDQHYPEYFEHRGSFRMIWVLRNPYSTIYSLLHNWPRWAFDYTFQGVVAPTLTSGSAWLYRTGGTRWFGRVRQACHIYNLKQCQLPLMMHHLGAESFKVIEYDSLVLEPEETLAEIYRFLALEFKPKYAKKIHAKSIDKRRRLSLFEKLMIRRWCADTYRQAQAFLFPS